MEILFLKPVYKDYIWGGTRLKNEFYKNTPYERTAESWEISTNKNGKSIIVNGKYKGKNLEEVFEIKECRKDIFGNKCLNMTKFPLLVKFIDAKKNLSVQVHPDDEYAKKYENDSGKSEMWYVMDCPQNAKLICGLKDNIKTKEQLELIIRNEKIKESLQYVDIEKGDSIYIPAGTIHAILSDILICEIQQNSDVTYRVYDWDRIDENGKSRELHIDKAIDVINLNNKMFKVKYDDIMHQKLLETEYLKVDKVKINNEYCSTSNKDTFMAVSVIDGEGKIFTKNKEYNIRKGNSFIIPSKLGKYRIVGRLTILNSYI